MGTMGRDSFFPDLTWCFGRGEKIQKLSISLQKAEEKEVMF